MSDPYLGEIRYFAGTYAPRGWTYCEGQLLPISENQALYSLIGTLYGGDGRNTFGLPDLRGKVTVGYDPRDYNFRYGAMGGQESVTLNQLQLAGHQHATTVDAALHIGASDQLASRAVPEVGDVLGKGKELETSSPLQNYAPPNAGGTVVLAGTTVSASATLDDTGGATPHENRMPFGVINAIIALKGTYPPRP